jgi:hypothetical protein
MARRPRGTVGTTIASGWKVLPVTKTTVTEEAARAGISAAYFVDLMVANLPRDPKTGLPPWVPVQSKDGELPIDSA